MKPTAVFLFALLLAGYAGALHPAFDSLAVLRVPLACAHVAVLLRRPFRLRLTLAMAALALTALLHVYQPLLRPAQEAGDITLYQLNLWTDNRAHGQVLRQISDYDPDVITFQEVSDVTAPIFQALKQDYPHQVICRSEPLYGVAVLSRLPLGDGAPRCLGGRGFAALPVQLEDGTGWIVSVHLAWPWPLPQPDQVREMLHRLESAEGPMIIAGDFNHVPWSHIVRNIAQQTGTKILGPNRKTFSVVGLPLPIDHVLARTGTVTRLERPRSDHHALLARVSF
ncbi:MAG: endonuclease/exonuclease/phosphatase family protein [Pseudomonadota bacterium]